MSCTKPSKMADKKARRKWLNVIEEIKKYKKHTPAEDRNLRDFFSVYQVLRKRDRGYGTSPLNVGLLLYALVFLLKPKVYVELGNFLGWTVVCVATALKENKQGKLYAIDISKEYQESAKKLIKKKGLVKYVEFINAPSEDKNNLDKIDSRIDFLYIDTHHIYKQTKKELLLYKDRIKKGGLIIFHDYCPRFKGVVRAANEILKGKSWHKIPYYGALGVAIFQKIK